MAFFGRLLPQTSISLNKDAVDVVELSALLAATRQNCLQFPLLQADGSLAEAAHPPKLRLALQYSTLVVSIHMQGPIPGGDYMHPIQREHQQHRVKKNLTPFLLGQSRPVPRLIAFGRATSDHALTASIHDIAVRFVDLSCFHVIGGRDHRLFISVCFRAEPAVCQEHAVV
ncbi:hypothetical protein L7F22_020096 [Adiantum nelumboides]|nr:hypothetical protein [Adiantum nelumboides]